MTDEGPQSIRTGGATASASTVRSRRRGRILVALGYALLLGFAALAVVAWSLFEDVDLDLGLIGDILGKGTFNTVFIAVVLSGFGFGAWTVRLGRKHLAAAAEVVGDDRRPPVLYLRSFLDEDVTAKSGGGFTTATEEEQLADVLGAIGPVVAIGRPGEELPELGAARLYAADADWQATVADLMERAGLVVLRAGDSPGLWWEVRAAARVPPERLVFVIPRTVPYETFREKVQAILPTRLPDLDPAEATAVPVAALLYFTPDWEARLQLLAPGAMLRRSLRTPFRSSLAAALRPVFEQLGVPWRRPPPAWDTVALFSLIGVLVVGALAMLAVFGIPALLEPESPYASRSKAMWAEIEDWPEWEAFLEKAGASEDGQAQLQALVVDGLLRLGDDDLMFRHVAMKRLLDSLPAAECAAIIGGWADEAANADAFDRLLDVETIERWFAILEKAYRAALTKTPPARPVSRDEVARATEVLQRYLTQEELSRLRAVQLNSLPLGYISNEDMCWVQRTLLRAELDTPEPYRGILARDDVQLQKGG
jgi:hypothetical protein